MEHFTDTLFFDFMLVSDETLGTLDRELGYKDGYMSSIFDGNKEVDSLLCRRLAQHYGTTIGFWLALAEINLVEAKLASRLKRLTDTFRIESPSDVSLWMALHGHTLDVDEKLVYDLLQE